MKSDSRTDVSALWARYRRRRPGSSRRAHSQLLTVGQVRRGPAGSSLPQTVDTADLISYGIFGLINAIEKYDLEPRHQVRDLCHRSHQGRDHRRTSSDGLGSALSAFSCRGDRERIRGTRERAEARSPAIQEVADRMDVSLKDFQDILTKLSYTSVVTFRGAVGGRRSRRRPECDRHDQGRERRRSCRHVREHGDQGDLGSGLSRSCPSGRRR